MVIVIFIILASTSLVNCEPFSNVIQGEPEVDCSHGSITFRVKTINGLPSYIFAKGQFRKEGCVFSDTATVNFTLEHCNVHKKREANPRGMAYSMTVVVQLHPQFVTRVDRAYSIRCFYMEANRAVDTELGVSDLTTSMLESGHVMPQCSYTLHRDSANGPILRYARVGDTIYHVWDCPSDVYVMLIHSCYIQDGQGGEHPIIDSNGCTTDSFVLPQLTYSAELTRAFATASVVNLPDRQSIYFSCQIKICFKNGDYCSNVSPPKCGELSTSKYNMREDFLDDQLYIGRTNASMEEVGATTDAILELIISSTNITTDMHEIVEKAEETISHEASNDQKMFDPAVFSDHSFSAKFNMIVASTTSDEMEGSGEDEITISSTTLPDHRRSLTPSRDRRKVAGSNDKTMVDLDVSTQELNILDTEFEYPNLLVQPQLQQKNLQELLCSPLYGVWILSGLCIISTSIAIGALFRLRLSYYRSTQFCQ